MDSDQSHLISDVLRLSLYSHPGDAGQVNERQVRNIRRGDLQTNEVITDPHPDPGHFILSWRERAWCAMNTETFKNSVACSIST